MARRIKGDDLTLNVPVAPMHGGTGLKALEQGDILVAIAASTPTLARLAKGSEGQVLSIVSGAPAWDDASGGGGGSLDPTTTLIKFGAGTADANGHLQGPGDDSFQVYGGDDGAGNGQDLYLFTQLGGGITLTTASGDGDITLDAGSGAIDISGTSTFHNDVTIDSVQLIMAGGGFIQLDSGGSIGDGGDSGDGDVVLSAGSGAITAHGGSVEIKASGAGEGGGLSIESVHSDVDVRAGASIFLKIGGSTKVTVDTTGAKLTNGGVFDLDTGKLKLNTETTGSSTLAIDNAPGTALRFVPCKLNDGSDAYMVVVLAPGG